MEHLVSHYGLLAIFVLMVLESACIPVPSEVTMCFGGALASATNHHDRLSFGGVIAVGVAGNLLGSLLGWLLGRFGLMPAATRWGRFLGVRPAHVEAAQKFFTDHKTSAALVGRMLPGVRTFISAPAGAARVPLPSFLFNTLVGCVIWVTGLALLGYELGTHWHVLVRPFAFASLLTFVIVACLFAWSISRRLRKNAESTL